MEENHRNDRGRASKVRFGPFELDVRAAELRKEGRCIRLQEQPFQILRMLLDSPGEVVLRDKIRSTLWPNGTVVEFDHSINAAVKRLRDALRDSAEKPRYIETLARRGYRFIGTVEVEVPEQPLPEPPGTNGDSAFWRPPTQAPPRRTRILTPALLAGTVLLIVAGAWLYQRLSNTRWAREVALPEATRLVSTGDYPAAFPLLYRAIQILPEDSDLVKLRRGISYAVSINTNPPGGDVQVKPYGARDSEWFSIGEAPIKTSCCLSGISDGGSPSRAFGLWK